MYSFEENIRKVEPYVPGEQPTGKVIKLNTNENPYPPAKGVTEALESMNTDLLRKYPDPTADILVKELADFYNVGEEQVFVGVGSDDVLSMCFLTFFNSDKPIFSRISRIHFMKYGRTCTASHIRARSWIRILRLFRKIITEKMEA